MSLDEAVIAVTEAFTIQSSTEKWELLVNILLLVLTFGSVICAFWAYVHQKDREKMDAACELARYYSEDVIQRYNFINAVLTMSGNTAEIKKLFPLQSLKNFDRAEMEQILKESGHNPQQIVQRMMSVNPMTIFQAKIRTAKTIEERHALVQEYIDSHDTQGETGQTKMKNIDLLQYEFNGEVTMLLNNLEWFAMSCRYGLADEKMLYQSLHQTFLSHIWINNRNNEDKLFTNIIWLFILWRDRLREIQEKTQREQEEKNRKVAEKQRDLEQAKKEAASVQAPVYTGKQLK